MTHTLDIAGFTVTIGAIVAAVAVAQWLLIIASAGWSKERPPKTGMRDADRRLLVSTAVFAIAWIGVFGSFRGESKTSAAAIVATKPHASCSSITDDMTAAAVKAKLGDPDETRSEEDTRGPGAAKWIYRDSRCTVHVLDDRVEFID